MKYQKEEFKLATNPKYKGAKISKLEATIIGNFRVHQNLETRTEFPIALSHKTGYMVFRFSNQPDAVKCAQYLQDNIDIDWNSTDIGLFSSVERKTVSQILEICKFFQFGKRISKSQ